MSGDIRGQRPEDLVCYEDSCVCKWAVVIRTQHRMSVSCGAPNRAWPSRRAIFSPQKQEISHGQSRPVGSAPQVQRVCFDGRIATIQKAGRRPLPSKTGGLQPPELPLALPSGHTWAPWGGQGWLPALPTQFTLSWNCCRLGILQHVLLALLWRPKRRPVPAMRVTWTSKQLYPPGPRGHSKEWGQARAVSASASNAPLPSLSFPLPSHEPWLACLGPRPESCSCKAPLPLSP